MLAQKSHTQRAYKPRLNAHGPPAACQIELPDDSLRLTPVRFGKFQKSIHRLPFCTPAGGGTKKLLLPFCREEKSDNSYLNRQKVFFTG